MIHIIEEGIKSHPLGIALGLYAIYWVFKNHIFATPKDLIDNKTTCKNEIKEALKSETQKLTNLLEQSAKYFQEAAQSSASAGAQQAQTGAGQSSEAPKNDAVDADFEVVDDDDSKKSS